MKRVVKIIKELRRKPLFLLAGTAITLVALPLLIVLSEQKQQKLQYAEASNTYANAITIIENRMDAFVQQGATAVINANAGTSQQYQNIPQYCDAAFEAEAAIQSMDATRASQYNAYGKQIADWLVAHDDDNGDGLPGWGIPTAFDAFGDGTVNPANQEYALQDGAVVHCLADAYQQTQQSNYLTIAQTVINNYTNYWKAYTTTVDPICNNCGYFWYSTNPNDKGRFVKNTNMWMGRGVARLAQVTGNATYQQQAQQLLDSETYEINTRSNFKYHGYDDPDWSTSPQEGHETVELWNFADMGNIMHPTDPNYTTAVTALFNNFMACGSTCYFEINDVTENECATAQFNDTGKSDCQQYINANVSNLVGIEETLGILEALPIFALSSSTPTPIPTNTPTPLPTATPTPLPTTTPTPSYPNLLKNGSFEATGSNWLSPWRFQANSGATISQDSSTKADGLYSAKAYIKNASTGDNAVQLYQGGIPLNTNISFIITFWAKASAARQIRVSLNQAVSPWESYFSQSVSLTTSWQKYTMSFQASQSDSNALFIFNLAESKGYVWIDNVSVQ